MIDRVVELRNVSKSFGLRDALSNVNFELQRGDFTGLVGRNGAGKTTAIRIMAGVLQATSGEVKVLGQNMDPENAQVKARLGYVPSECQLFEHLTGRENLLFTAAAYRLDQKEAIRRGAELFDLLELGPDQHKRVHAYSFGMKKKASLACALLHDPDVVFLDEPVEGLDVMTSRAVKELFRFLRRNGKTILLTSHNFDLIEDLCDRVAIIDQGQLLFDGTAALLKEEADLPDTARLEDAFAARFAGAGRSAQLSWVGSGSGE